MKRYTFILLLTLLVCTSTVHAEVIGTVSSGSNSSSNKKPSSGDEQIYIPDFTYYPKITALHSLNAKLAETNNVYFIPKLDEFPTNPANVAANTVDYTGKIHSFATVYDGYFDAEVDYVRVQGSGSKNVANVQTSKKVYDSNDNSRTLTLLGYDLLLNSERCDISIQGNNMIANYSADKVGSQPLTASTVIMDLYKAMNQYEWDVKFGFCPDKSLKLTTSPVQEKLSVITDENVGVDNSEGCTWVWATRTNPELYWNKCKLDHIFSGGAHLATTNCKTAGSQTSVRFSKNNTASVTFGEFCSLARAIMELYGEPVMTDMERLIMIQNYGLTIPKSSNTEITQSIEYLAAKGILDPTCMDINKSVTFSDIEMILCRIRDKDSRLTIKETGFDKNSEFFNNAYIGTKVVISDTTTQAVEEVADPLHTSTGYYDYLIESKDGVTNFVLTADCDSGTEGTLLADRLSAGESSEYLGLTNTGFYYFKVNKAVSGNIVITYMDENDGTAEHLSMQSYTIPSGGGVYRVDNSDNITQHSFDSENYSEKYIDSVRNSTPSKLKGDLQLADTHWYRIPVEYTDTPEGLANAITYGQVQLGLGTLDVNQKLDVSTLATYENLALPTDTTWWRGEDEVTKDSSGNIVSKCAVYYCQTTVSPQSFIPALGSVLPAQELNDCFVHYSSTDSTDAVLVNTQDLIDSGVITSVNELPNNTGIVITSSSRLCSNVYMFSKTKKILVGNVLYSVPNETLYQKEGDTYYVNYRACIGWTSPSLSVYYDPQTATVRIGEMPTGSANKSKVWPKTYSVRTLFPNASQNIGGIDGLFGEGLQLSSSYALSNFIIVMHEGNDMDTLYIIKQQNLTDVNGNEVSLQNNENVKLAFEQDVGVSFDKLDTENRYCLEKHDITRSSGYKDDGGAIEFVQLFNNTTSSILPATTYGYVYFPSVQDDLRALMQQYCTGDIALPIVHTNYGVYNVNLNTCSVTTTDKKLPYGTLPYSFQVSSRKGLNALAEVQSTGVVTEKNSEDLSSLTVYPAPSGWFTGLLGGITTTVDNLDSAAPIIYLGTSKCMLKNTNDNQVYLNELLVGEGSLNLTCTYVPFAANAVYSVTDSSIGVNMPDASSGDFVTSFISAKESIDWDAYTFGRLVDDLDKWTSVLILLFLAILPRIFMVLYFILFMLAMIVDFPLWRKFNENVIDFYKLLSFGRLEVGRVDMKRLALQSLGAFSLFFMCCDGLLWNVIMWACKFILLLIQR